MFDLNYIELLQWIFAGLVLLILINNLYLIIKSNSRMMNKIMWVHDFFQMESTDENIILSRKDKLHFHNTDTIEGYFNTKHKYNKEIKDLYRYNWKGKKTLIVPNKKMVTFNKKGKEVDIYFNNKNEYSFFRYNIKINGKHLIRRRITKEQVEDYGGSFILGNILVKYENTNFIEIDCESDPNIYQIRIGFTDGGLFTFDFTKELFAKEMITTPNMVFLYNCDVLELV